MTLHNYKQYKLTVGSRNDAVRVVKQLLHSKSDNSYRTDGTNEYNSQLASAVSELQRKHRLPVTGIMGQAEYWALGKDVLEVRIQQLATGDQTLGNLLRGGILGNAFAESSTLADGSQDIDSITVTGDHWVDWSFDDGRTARSYVLPETKETLNANQGSLATNVIRAIKAVNALKEFPTAKTKMGLAGSITLQGSVGIEKKGAPTGTAGGAIQVGGSYEKEYDSTDGILRELRNVNEAIRINTARAIAGHNIAVPNADPKIADVMKPLGDVPASNASNMAVSFVDRAAELANEIAQNEYRKWTKKSVPQEFNNWLTGIKVF